MPRSGCALVTTRERESISSHRTCQRSSHQRGRDRIVWSRPCYNTVATVGRDRVDNPTKVSDAKVGMRLRDHHRARIDQLAPHLSAVVTRMFRFRV